MFGGVGLTLPVRHVCNRVLLGLADERGSSSGSLTLSYWAWLVPYWAWLMRSCSSAGGALVLAERQGCAPLHRGVAGTRGRSCSSAGR